MTTSITITQEAFETIVRQEVANYLKNDKVTKDEINNQVLSLCHRSLKEHIDKLDLMQIVKDQLTAMVEPENSFVKSSLRKLYHDCIERLENNPTFLNNTCALVLKEIIYNHQTYTSIIEPELTKLLINNEDFLTYARGLINTKLNTKIKNLGAMTSEVISTNMLKQLLLEYNNRRFGENNDSQ